MNTANANKRQHDRVEEPVCTWLEFSTEHAAYSSVTHDLGKGGARLSAKHAIKPGDPIRLSMQFPSGPMTVNARVCWARMIDGGVCDFGVAFDGDTHEIERNLRGIAPESL